MNWTVMFGLGWCGFGFDGGLLRELRLGVVRVAWCRGWIGERIARWHEALAACARGIGA